MSATLAFLNHDLGGLDDRGHLVALLQAHFFRTPFGDDRLDDVVADLHSDERGDGAENHLGDFALQVIASAECHNDFLLTCLYFTSDAQVQKGMRAVKITALW